MEDIYNKISAVCSYFLSVESNIEPQYADDIMIH